MEFSPYGVVGWGAKKHKAAYCLPPHVASPLRYSLLLKDGVPSLCICCIALDIRALEALFKYSAS
jgi:hypothetical protein